MATLALTPDTLSATMDFDHVIKVTADGTIEEPTGIYAPDCEWDKEHDILLNYAPYKDCNGWSLLTGYTGQYSYNGPTMHASEYIGGGLARDIMATPGYYVSLVVEYRCYDDPDEHEPRCTPDLGCDCEPAGWAIAYRPLED